MAMRIAIFGHSGIGKSHLKRLFKVKSFEPFRVRIPRDKDDARVCKSPQEFQKLLSAHDGYKPLSVADGDTSNLRIFENWSFFKIRDKDDQCLEHTPGARNPAVPLMVEIYAPVFFDILRAQATIPEMKNKVLSCDKEDLLIILLNPTSFPFKEMKSGPSMLFRLAAFTAVVERYRVQGKQVDLTDALRRVEFIDEELLAWQKLIEYGFTVVECLNWPYFEFTYADLADVGARFIKVRRFLLHCVNTQAPGKLVELESLILTPEEIVELG